MAVYLPDPGTFRASIRIERLAAQSNVGGVTKTSWTSPTVLASAKRAKIEPKYGGEEVIAGRMSGRSKYTIWLLQDDVLRTVTNADRIVNNRTGEIYNIGTPVDPDNSRYMFMIDATSIGNAGGEG